MEGRSMCAECGGEIQGQAVKVCGRNFCSQAHADDFMEGRNRWATAVCRHAARHDALTHVVFAPTGALAMRDMMGRAATDLIAGMAAGR